MSAPRSVLCALLCCSILVLGVGCDKKTVSQAPVPLPVDKAPSTLQEAFAKATGDSKQMADDAVMYLSKPDYPAALLVLQNLLHQTDLTADQSRLAAQAMLTANKMAAEAARNGDTRAEKILDMRRAAK